jgi:hypothetical protein
MSDILLIEPETVDPDLWFGQVDETAALLICAAEMSWSQCGLWQRVVLANWRRGVDVGPEEVPTGTHIFTEWVASGAFDLVTALQIADYYVLMMLGQRGYNSRVLELSVESFYDSVQGEDSTENGTYSALAAGYYSAFTRDDCLGRNQLLAVSDPKEVGDALALLFVMAHTDMHDEDEEV